VDIKLLFTDCDLKRCMLIYILTVILMVLGLFYPNIIVIEILLGVFGILTVGTIGTVFLPRISELKNKRIR